MDTRCVLGDTLEGIVPKSIYPVLLLIGRPSLIFSWISLLCKERRVLVDLIDINLLDRVFLKLHFTISML